MIEQGLGSLRGAIGTPDQIRELVRRYEEAGVDQLIFISQAGRNRHEDICESMELFAREVMAEFKERAEKTERLKSERLAPAIEAALARRSLPGLRPPTTPSRQPHSSSEGPGLSELVVRVLWPGQGRSSRADGAVHAVSD